MKNFESLGMGLMETGMAWFWPTHRVARWTETSGVNEGWWASGRKAGHFTDRYPFSDPSKWVRECTACLPQALASTVLTITR
ncbi:lipid A biosynthesis (KDO) 2-(lauroyl)-lipid IVA acyltransferase [Klebsiella pneumoniae]|uniref:Lipid A biosynthesis (KDO) 2-(Lauroyl)-lipid IVA acyltransferase n=1 Tax=Klebsiella pneumoniae TaxID=573 RepID=A0A2X3CKE0_KLEPN|nr:lipid A biosynthesis (KDO) 2-(lauroyl)-lipid IVA acyltransferase [Klebsiella pneumoniae]